MWPISVDETDVHAHMLVHEDQLPEKPDEYWQKNFQSTMTALDEDYEMAESIQTNLRAGAHQERTFGRNEVGLQRFHEWLERRLYSPV